MASHLRGDVPGLKMPVFFLLGRLDMQVAAPVSAAYFDALEAPHKELIWFEESGHMVPFEEPERFNRVMIDTVRPFTA
jgi:pimeloyl-ACP methyl ester carboxylesterase